MGQWGPEAPFRPCTCIGKMHCFPYKQLGKTVIFPNFFLGLEGPKKAHHAAIFERKPAILLDYFFTKGHTIWTFMRA